MKWYKWVALIAGLLSALAMIISLVALCRCVPRCSNLELDYIGVIVGILSLLVTILLGWNIWSTIDSKGLEEKFEKKFKELESQENYDLSMMHCRYAQMLSIQIENLEKEDLKALMVHYVINSIVRAEKISIQSELNQLMKNIDTSLDTVIATFNETTYVRIPQEKAMELYERFGEIKNQDKIEKLKELKEHIAKYLK